MSDLIAIREDHVEAMIENLEDDGFQSFLRVVQNASAWPNNNLNLHPQFLVEDLQEIRNLATGEPHHELTTEDATRVFDLIRRAARARRGSSFYEINVALMDQVIEKAAKGKHRETIFQVFMNEVVSAAQPTATAFRRVLHLGRAKDQLAFQELIAETMRSWLTWRDFECFMAARYPTDFPYADIRMSAFDRWFDKQAKEPK